MPPLGLTKGGHKFFKGGQCPPPRGGREVPCHLMMRPPPQRGAKWTRLDEKLEDFMTTWDNEGYEVLKYLSDVSAAI